jgi:5-methylcytosine-specific restriction endonuclease McrA
MASKKFGIGHIAENILAVLRTNPDGLDIHQLQKIVDPDGSQRHFDRRLRGLDPHYDIARERDGQRIVYKYKGPRKKGEWDYAVVSKALQAKVRAKAAGRCQMCGRTISEDHIKLHVDHKIPRSWNGSSIEENLWAICSGCNEGKKNFFSSLNNNIMKQVMNLKSVHARIGRFLKLYQGEWVDSDLIEFVANFNDHQQDWHKRLRELRYLGLRINSRRVKKGKRHLSQYQLVRWVPLPENPSEATRKYETQRARRNKGMS